MNQELDYSLLPPCCNSGCTTCVLDYPELYLGSMDAQTHAMLEAIEKVDQQAAETFVETFVETGDFQWTNSANKN